MQLALPLKIPVEYGADDFIVSGCNLAAYRALMQEGWPSGRILIVGEKGSGKSHLASIWEAQNNAHRLGRGDSYTDLSVAHLILEDIQNIKDEGYLFHLLNHAAEHKVQILLTASVYPTFTLKDLQSRINATPLFLITDPDESLVRILLHKQFCDKQIIVASEVLDYLVARIERSFTSVVKLVEDIDAYAMQNKRLVTIPLIKQVFDAL
jgi:chromosomal replication initiation ATPase DnaA